MENLDVVKLIGRRAPLLVLLVALVLLLPPVHARAPEIGSGLSAAELEFRKIAEQGFGSRHNSKAWSMIWWRGNLYVGTARAHMCVEYWALADTVGWLFQYPPDDPDMECTENPQDLPLRAEIWRYIPETDAWDLVFQSPNDVQIPEHPDKYTARDSGFRGITAFTDLDGTEALYIFGVTSESMNPGMPPPRILRTTDGENWEPVPQDPGTLLGDLGRGQANFRDTEIYKDRLYVINGGLRGGGSVLEAEDPAGGNDNFRWVTPRKPEYRVHLPLVQASSSSLMEKASSCQTGTVAARSHDLDFPVFEGDDLRVYALAEYKGYLYLGTQATLDDRNAGYGVMKTDATGTPPYTYTVVVDEGAYLTPLPSNAVVSMFEYEGRLYIGTDKPAEMIRVNPDDSWDLIVGAPREAPDGLKEPLSGMGTGFDWLLNEHIWRMGEHLGDMYVGTNDATAFMKEYRFSEPFLEAMGYDLFVTPNGVDYTMLTRTGFGDQLDIGIRVFASTPYGLFFGTSNPYYGFHIQLGEPGPGKVSGQRAGVVTPSLDVFKGLDRNPRRLNAPEHVGLENYHGGAVLSWEPVLRAAGYRVFRSAFVSAREMGVHTAKPDLWIPQPFEEIATTSRPFFADRTLQHNRVYHYYVLAESPDGTLSFPSNLVRSPSLNTPTTVSGLHQTVMDWMGHRQIRSHSTPGDVLSVVISVQEQLETGDLQGALGQLGELRAQVRLRHLPKLSWWRAEDLELLLGKLMRRIRLAQAGILATRDLR